MKKKSRNSSVAQVWSNSTMYTYFREIFASIYSTTHARTRKWKWVRKKCWKLVCTRKEGFYRCGKTRKTQIRIAERVTTTGIWRRFICTNHILRVERFRLIAVPPTSVASHATSHFYAAVHFQCVIIHNSGSKRLHIFPTGSVTFSSGSNSGRLVFVFVSLTHFYGAESIATLRIFTDMSTLSAEIRFQKWMKK